MAPGIEEKKEKRSWGSKFFNFLVYGGFLVIIFVIAAIYILITVLWK